MIKGVLPLLRRVRRAISDRTARSIRRQRLRKHISKPEERKVYVIGTPSHTNLGDSAIVLAEILFLKNCGISSQCIKEITTQECREARDVIHSLISEGELLCWHGGGNMGDQWIGEEYLRRNMLQEYRKNPNIVFPQTLHYSDTESGMAEKQASVAVYCGCEDLTLVAREQPSFDQMKVLYPDLETLLTPDIVLSAIAEDFGVGSFDRKGILLCMRSDLERAMSDEVRAEIENYVCSAGYSYRLTDMYADRVVTKDTRMQHVRAKMEEFAAASVVITDRLHGMVFAAITGTPCIVFSNYNHKVRGTYEWIKHLPYIRFAETVEDVKKNLPELLAMTDCHYDKTPLEPYFEKLAEVVKRYVHN